MSVRTADGGQGLETGDRNWGQGIGIEDRE